MTASHGSVRVALLNQTNQHGDHLKDALRELGASVVYEAVASDIDRDALEGSGARVVVVNLDSNSDSQIDEVYDLLDSANYEVVFNEAQTSSQLSGWDHARWARHLAAKILHKPEIAVPPRPPGAEAVPTPVQKSAASVPVAEKPSTYHFEEPLLQELPPDLEPEIHREAAPEIVPEVRARSEAPTLELPAVDESLLPPSAHRQFEAVEPVEEPAQTQTTGDSRVVSDFAAELDALFADAGTPSPAAAAPSDGLALELDESITMESDKATSAPKTEDPFDGFDLSFDLPDEHPAQSNKNAEDELALEFPAIFDQLDTSEVPSAVNNPFKSEASAAEDRPTAADVPVVPPDWLLEPVEEEAQVEESKPAPAKPTTETFGIEKVSAQDYLAHDVDQATEQQRAVLPTASGMKLELMPMEEAVAPQPAPSNYKSEAWLDGSRPAQKVRASSGTVEHVFVLGASIGGPEAVREFLVALPAGFPMLFVLVQHMGEEFLELMSAQLAKAVALTVRNPVHGERIGHGDIVVVPTTHRLKIDGEGVVTLAHLPERPTYNPSIDMVLRDMSDQFGSNVGAIIFSGMAHDAIEGSQYLKSKGGVIWAQDPDTCAISTMVDGVKEAGVVDFIGSPEQLAAKMIAEYKV
jgi:chemosensory pili system protein ChpB (putative protein-glutamate methylesterase)